MSHEDSSEMFPDLLPTGRFSDDEEEAPIVKVKAEAKVPQRFFATGAKSAPMEAESSFLRRRNAAAQTEEPETIFAMSCSPVKGSTKQ